VELQPVEGPGVRDLQCLVGVGDGFGGDGLFAVVVVIIIRSGVVKLLVGVIFLHELQIRPLQLRELEAEVPRETKEVEKVDERVRIRIRFTAAVPRRKTPLLRWLWLWLLQLF